MYHYKKEQGSFALYEKRGDKFEFIQYYDQVALAFIRNTESGALLLRHGSLDRVQDFMKKKREQYESSGLWGESAKVELIFSDQWDIEELNQILQNSNYLEKWLMNQENKEFSVLPRQRPVCLTGGAEGSDYAWEQMGIRSGHAVQVLSFAGHYLKCRGDGNLLTLPEEILKEANPYLLQANKTLKRRFPSANDQTNNLLRRSYWVVKEVSQVLALGYLMPNKRQVKRGTGWAIQMAIDLGIPEIRIFDLGQEKWFRYDKLLGIFEEDPTLFTFAEIYAGIGTRPPLTRKGIEEIIKIHERTKRRNDGIDGRL